jgi:hypothetical protein
MLQLYGVAPPVADREAVYGTLASAAGIVDDANASEPTGVTVTVADAEIDRLALSVLSLLERTLPLVAALMSIGVEVLTVGAVKNPLLEMVPALADQITPVFEVPVTRAVNCNPSSDTMVALPGETEIVFEVEALTEATGCDCEPQAVVKPNRQSNIAITITIRLSIVFRSTRLLSATVKCRASNIEDNLRAGLGDRRLILECTVMKGRREGQVTDDHGPSGHVGTYRTYLVLSGLKLDKELAQRWGRMIAFRARSRDPSKPVVFGATYLANCAW